MSNFKELWVTLDKNKRREFIDNLSGMCAVFTFSGVFVLFIIGHMFKFSWIMALGLVLAALVGSFLAVINIWSDWLIDFNPQLKEIGSVRRYER